MHNFTEDETRKTRAARSCRASTYVAQKNMN